MMSQRTDANGAVLKTGDVLMDIGSAGGGSGPNGSYKTIDLWQLPSSHDGSGFTYDSTGKRGRYWWTHLRSSVKIDESNTPDGFLYSFFHGMETFEVYGDSDGWFVPMKGTVQEIIAKSNWEKYQVKQEMVDKSIADREYVSKLVLNTQDDFVREFKRIWEIENPSVELLTKILTVFGVKIPPVSNGEIGLHYLGMLDCYHNILRSIFKNKS
jgi:hypothetical protein